ncbi:NADH dehydrogenase subunit 2 (mitochondrion) [Aethina tumida]|uniref:NADH-ubiquinone oxidoreductase chain 2 n=1 Tax=Aethina tumida TaxID=116153 RepID=A0A343KHU6_AETTU|nr:NADH dehydrogenase subunit 2 [Aethina tumida]ATG28316.1 NADH dehydrogenase subunit 2 [Aethina tumida]
MKFYKLLFFNSLIFGSLLAISSFSWFSMWMGLEINLLSIIPLMNSKSNLYPSESSIKYFITQTIASSLILIAIMINLNMLEYIPQYFNTYLNIMMNSGFLMKMGAAPFHFWFPEIMEGLNWLMCLIMLTWQKIAPMILLMSNLKLNIFITSTIIISSLISGIQGINQISIRKILAYSSINHIGWMLASMMYSNSTWMIYFITYSLISINLILVMYNLNIFFLKQLFNSLNYKKMLKFLFSLNFLSLGGLPPFLGFLPKWLTINLLVQNNLFLISAILIVLTLLTLFYYLRISSNSLVIYSSENLSKMFYLKNLTIIFNSITLSALVLCTFILNL